LQNLLAKPSSVTAAEHHPALAHRLKDTAEAAFARGDLFNKRRELMMAWAGFAMQGSTSADRRHVSLRGST